MPIDVFGGKKNKRVKGIKPIIICKDERGIAMTDLIINADDFGMTDSCTKAIIEAFKEKKITSTTMCANGHHFGSAVNLALENNFENRVGIHLNITEGEPLTDSIKSDPLFCDKNGLFHGKINRFKPLPKRTRINVYKELVAQIKRLKNSGIPITHADSHHHIHIAPNLVNTIISAIVSCNIKKIRICRNIGIIPPHKYLAKTLYNRLYISRKLITTHLFGDANDLKIGTNIKHGKSLEIMVHPDFDEHGELIDKIFTHNNKKIVKPLHFDKSVISNYKLCSFYELKSKEDKRKWGVK